MNAPPFNLAAVESATMTAVRNGHRILQTHRYGPTDLEHVDYLLGILNPPPNAIVLDNGCGVGEVSRLMSRLRPDLRFVLTNISPLQLSLCPHGIQYSHVQTDSHTLNVRTASVDCVMFSSALCQMDEAIALREAHRVLKPGGILLVNEAVLEAGGGAELEAKLACRALLADALLEAVQAAGFEPTYTVRPNASRDHFILMLQEVGLGHLRDCIGPAIIRAIRSPA